MEDFSKYVKDVIGINNGNHPLFSKIFKDNNKDYSRITLIQRKNIRSIMNMDALFGFLQEKSRQSLQLTSSPYDSVQPFPYPFIVDIIPMDELTHSERVSNERDSREIREREREI